MIAAMLYAVTNAALLSVIAWVIERGMAARRLPRRGVWACAVALSVLVPIGTLVVAKNFSHDDVANHNVVIPVRPPLLPNLSAPTYHEVRVVPIASSTHPPGRRDLDPSLIALCVGSSVLAALFYGILWLQLLWRIRHLPGRWVDREFVCLTEDLGPAVIGASDPRILLPKWFLELSPAVRDVAIEHERQHIRARDPLLWQSALLLAVVMPWNPIMWWQLRRLRFAQELDCDARVVRSGVDAAVYAETLLAVGSRGSRTAFAAFALTEHRSQIEARIWTLFEEARLPRRPLVLLALLASSIASATQLSAPRVDLSIGTNTLLDEIRSSTQPSIRARSNSQAAEGTEELTPAALRTTRVIEAEWTRLGHMPEILIIGETTRESRKPAEAPSVPQTSLIAVRTSWASRWFDIPAGDATETLREVFGQSGLYEAGLGILYGPDDVRGVRTQEVLGMLTPQSAINRLLEGTSLRFDEQSFNIRRAAQVSSSRYRFDLRGEGLDAMLQEFARQGDVRVAWQDDGTANVTTQPVTGVFASGEALRRLLSGTGFSYIELRPRSYSIVTSANALHDALRGKPGIAFDPFTPE